MGQRALLATLLRALGIWACYETLTSIAVVLPVVDDDPAGDALRWWLPIGAMLAGGVFLLTAGGWIARKLERDDAPASHLQLDGLRFACQLVGVYALFQSLHPLAGGLADLWTVDEHFSFVRTSPRARWLQVGAYIAFGTVLLVGPSRIGRWLRRIFGGTSSPKVGPGVGAS
jgi:hypothetical protein